MYIIPVIVEVPYPISNGGQKFRRASGSCPTNPLHIFTISTIWQPNKFFALKTGLLPYFDPTVILLEVLKILFLYLSKLKCQNKSNQSFTSEINTLKNKLKFYCCNNAKLK